MGKKPTYPKFGTQCALVVSSEQIWAVGFPRLDQRRIGDSGPPPCLSTFKRRGGGSGIGGAPLQRSRSKRPDQRREGRFRTPPPPAFLPLSGGGGGPESGVQLSTDEISVLGSTTLEKPHPSQLPCL
jgi:hypothetical protein